MFKNLKIVKKLVIAFILVALISSISGILGVYLFSKSDADYSAALRNYGFAQGKIGRLGMYINEGRAVIRDIVFLSEDADLQRAKTSLDKVILNSDAALEEVRPTNTTDAEKTLFAKIESQISEYRSVRDRVVELGMANNRDAAYAIWMGEAYPMVNALAENVEELLNMKSTFGTEVSNSLTALGRTMMIVMIASIFACFIISILFAIYISRGISKPIIQIESAADKMATGDYDIDLTYQAKDEIGALAQSMRTMVKTTGSVISDTTNALQLIADGNFDLTLKAHYIGVYSKIEESILSIQEHLTATLTQVSVAASQVASGSDQVSSGAQSLAQGATEQASSVQQLLASVSEIAAQVKENAGNADDASKLVITVGQNIDESNEQMSHMTVAMDEISDSSSKISKIIKTIEDIAFQTNILALNAAVEAARAGAAGKGFAVVADEVRNLATKSSEAAKQTNDLIENSIVSVEKGSKIAADTAHSLAAVVKGSSAITALITKISQATAEQSTSIAQINLGVEQISTVVQTNSATSEQSAAASEELSSQATLMNQLISKFNLKVGAQVNQMMDEPAHEEPVLDLHRYSPTKSTSFGGKY